MPVEFHQFPGLERAYQGTTSVVPLKQLQPQGFSPRKFRETISFSTMEEEQNK
jgi:hypothetical protein